jgi:hypothetical protein
MVRHWQTHPGGSEAHIPPVQLRQQSTTLPRLLHSVPSEKQVTEVGTNTATPTARTVGFMTVDVWERTLFPTPVIDLSDTCNIGRIC